jgi:hypothetical protein
VLVEVGESLLEHARHRFFVRLLLHRRRRTALLFFLFFLLFLLRHSYRLRRFRFRAVLFFRKQGGRRERKKQAV